MNTAYLLLGTNLGEREKQLHTAITLLNEECGKIIATSGIYETAAWGKTDQPPYLNQALKIETLLTARQLLRSILNTEKKMGRVRKEKYGPRLIDIDILLYNNEVHDFPMLKLPHPELQNRRFALMPLAEIAPDLMHPVFYQKISKLLKLCADNLEVKKYS